MYAIYLTSQFMLDYSTTFYNVIFLLLAIPSAITFLYWFYSKLLYYGKLFFKSLDKTEKGFLVIAICVSSILIIISYNITSIFTKAYVPEEKRKYTMYYEVESNENIEKGKILPEMVYSVITGNVLYTFDTQFLLDMDIYNNINASENDIRQPLFAVFSLPYTILPRLLSEISFDEIYLPLIAIIQAIIIFVTIILLEKMMKLKGLSRLLFMIFLSVAYPTLLFMLNMEQYVIHVFYLIVFIYMGINKIQDKDMAYIMATGTLLTSGILFPLLGEKNNIKNSIKNIFITFLKFMAIFIISARVLLLSPNKVNSMHELYTNFTKPVTSSVERINMYTHFALNTIVSPQTEVREDLLPTKLMVIDGQKFFIKPYNTYISQTNNTNTNILGIIILCITFLGFIFNRKDSFSKICFVWILFSFVLLSIIGYGADENGFILYAYYFSWAFVCLLFKFFETVLQKWPKVKNTIYALAIIPVAVINFYGIYQLIEFGLQYYC